jgi:hypothetical protein
MQAKQQSQPKLLTLHPAFPRARAVAFPIPLEAPVTITTGASSLVASFTTACSTAATWVCTPADRSFLSTDYKETIRLFPACCDRSLKRMLHSLLLFLKEMLQLCIGKIMNLLRKKVL